MRCARLARWTALVLLAAAPGCKKKDAPPPWEGKTVTRADAPPSPPAPIAPPPAPTPAVAAKLTLAAPVDIGLPRALDASSGGEAARIIWQNLDKLKSGCASNVNVLELPTGSVRTFGCYLFSVLPYQALSVLSGKPVFLQGPHLGDLALDPTSKPDFGRYNPEFVRWAVETLVPGAADVQFRLATQPLYDRLVRPLARVALVVREEMNRDRARLVFERAAFKAALASESPPQLYAFGGFLSRSPWLADPATKEAAGGDDQVVDNVAAFWIRRDADKTFPGFSKGLDKLMTAYDAEFLAKVTALRLAKDGVPAWTGMQATRYLRYAWEHLAETPYGCEGSVTYELGETGLRAVWCHLGSIASQVRYGRLAGLAPFLSGQPNDKEAVLDQRADFGHYNPAFVRWLADNVIPGEGDAAFRQATQATFDANLRYVARTYWVTWTYAQENPEFLAKKVDWFKQQLAAKTLPESWYWELDGTLRETPVRQRALDAGFQADESGPPHVGGALGFWVRRSVDGTAAEFARGLEKLLKTYDPAFLGAMQSKKAPDAPPSPAPVNLAGSWRAGEATADTVWIPAAFTISFAAGGTGTLGVAAGYASTFRWRLEGQRLTVAETARTVSTPEGERPQAVADAGEQAVELSWRGAVVCLAPVRPGLLPAGCAARQ